MARLVAILGCAILGGCNPSGGVTSAQPVDDGARIVDASSVAHAFLYDKSRHIISLDTRVAPPQRQRFDIGLGSVTLETMHATDHELTFRYTPEIEGGYTTYECTVPISPAFVEIQIAPDGTVGATSFDLGACKVIGHGNLHGPSRAQ